MAEPKIGRSSFGGRDRLVEQSGEHDAIVRVDELGKMSRGWRVDRIAEQVFQTGARIGLVSVYVGQEQQVRALFDHRLESGPALRLRSLLGETTKSTSVPQQHADDQTDDDRGEAQQAALDLTGRLIGGGTHLAHFQECFC